MVYNTITYQWSYIHIDLQNIISVQYSVIFANNKNTDTVEPLLYEMQYKI